MDKVYQHPNCESRLKIKRRNGNIVTCYQIDKVKEPNVHGEMVFPVIITNINNLFQSTLF